MSTSSPSVCRRLNLTGITTKLFTKKQKLVEFIESSIPKELIEEGMVLAVTSKIISVAEECYASASIDKQTLIQQEADHYLGEVGFGTHLTIKEGLFIASAGIDQSNSETGEYLLYPPKPYESAKKLWSDLKDLWGLTKLGIILTDSHTTPLRRGVTGIALSHWGFSGVEDKRGQKDLFGRELKVTTINWADALAVSAVAVMGEGAECCPLAVIHGAQVEFSDDTQPEEVRIPLEEDMYRPFFEAYFKANSR